MSGKSRDLVNAEQGIRQIFWEGGFGTIGDFLPRWQAYMNALNPTPAPSADAEQIDDQVQDVLTTRMAEGIVELTGIWIEPDSESIRSIYRNFRKDLASLGIRLTYDTTIGVE